MNGGMGFHQKDYPRKPRATLEEVMLHAPDAVTTICPTASTPLKLSRRRKAYFPEGFSERSGGSNLSPSATQSCQLWHCRDG